MSSTGPLVLIDAHANTEISDLLSITRVSWNTLFSSVFAEFYAYDVKPLHSVFNRDCEGC